MEIVAAVDSGNPPTFQSFIPVHQVYYSCLCGCKINASICFQDGSCNGLQHYSALGKDFIGGQKVGTIRFC